MPPLKSAGAAARPAARTRASASSKSALRKKPAASKPKPRTNGAPHKPARRKTRRKLDAAPSPRPIRQPPPPRAVDPLARQTGARLAYYTPEFLAEAKRRVEETLQSTNAIAADFGMDHGPLWRLIRRYGWVRPEGALRRPRGLSPVMRLAAQADALVAPKAPPDPSPPLASLAGGGEVHPTPALRADPPPPGEGGTELAAPTSLDNATIERLEAAVLKELATVETMRASLRAEPRRPADDERTARTLSVLTETLSKLRRLRLAAQPQADTPDDILDIDEFRRDLARRIEAFVASQPDDECTDGNRDVALEAPHP